MPLPLIVTAVYPMPKRWMEAYFAGLAALQEPATLLLLREAGAILPDLDLSQHRVISAEAPAGTSGAALRRDMLQASRAEPAEFIVCVDFDDVIAPDAIALHRSALSDGEISYGDMVLIDDQDKSCGARFYDAMPVPGCVCGSATISRRNFFGFTNTAIRPSLLRDWDGMLPDHVVAADWWLYSRWLDDGVVAVSTTAPVVRYRSHSNSLLGARKASDLGVLRRRIEVALAHFAALPPHPHRDEAKADLLRLMGAVTAGCAEPERDIDALPQYCQWFQDVFALAGMVAARSSGRRA